MHQNAPLSHTAFDPWILAPSALVVPAPFHLRLKHWIEDEPKHAICLFIYQHRYTQQQAVESGTVSSVIGPKSSANIVHSLRIL